MAKGEQFFFGWAAPAMTIWRKWAL